MLTAEQELMYGKALSLGISTTINIIFAIITNILIGLQVDQKMLQLQIERGLDKNDTISDDDLGKYNHHYHITQVIIIINYSNCIRMLTSLDT